VLEQVGIAEPKHGHGARAPRFELSRCGIVEEGAFHVRGAASSRISGSHDAEIARIDLGNHAFSEDFALRQG
jgi:hypothetical protein